MKGNISSLFTCLRLWAVGLVVILVSLLFGPSIATAESCVVAPGLAKERAAHIVLINQIRLRAGLNRLETDEKLDRVAQDYACLLARTDHFDHVGPFGSTLSQRAAAGDVSFCLIAENLAKGHPTLNAAMKGWMLSPGHRDNLLRDSISRVGLGLVPAGKANAIGGGAANGRPRSLSDLAAGIVGAPLPAFSAPQGYVWVQVFSNPC